MEGKVKWFSEEKGYGFISVDREKDHFFNTQDLSGSDSPRNGDIVGFISVHEKKGMRASSVEILSNTFPEKDRWRNDYRVDCHCCGRKIVPRLVYGRSIMGFQAKPVESICPFCGTVYKEFGFGSRHADAFAKALLAMFVFMLIVPSLVRWVRSLF